MKKIFIVIGLVLISSGIVCDIGFGLTLTNAIKKKIEELDIKVREEKLKQETKPDTTPPVISNVLVSNIGYSRTTIAPTITATITWITDEPAITYVEYGTSTAYGKIIPEEMNFTTVHNTLLYNLLEKTTYYFSIRGKDRAGNFIGSNNNIFCTGFMYSPVSNVWYSSATITWCTSEPTSSKVIYSTSPLYCAYDREGWFTKEDSILVTFHRIELVNLSSSTLYYYVMTSTNSVGNTGQDIFVTRDGTIDVSFEIVMEKTNFSINEPIKVQSILTNKSSNVIHLSEIGIRGIFSQSFNFEFIPPSGKRLHIGGQRIGGWPKDVCINSGDFISFTFDITEFGKAETFFINLPWVDEYNNVQNDVFQQKGTYIIEAWYSSWGDCVWQKKLISNQLIFNIQ